jgi:hypothetical protein
MHAMHTIKTLRMLTPLFLLAACARAASGPAPVTPAATPTIESPSATPLSATATTIPEAASAPIVSTPVTNPLTGLPLENPDRLEQRPILIKVSNFPRNNRPQWGLSRADMVFEHYAEGGLTRFSALFYGQEAEVVGPIRSARFIDLQLVPMYGAIFAYGSADYRVREAIAESDFADRAVTEYPARCPPMCRYDPSNLNHLVTNTTDLREYLHAQGIPEAAVDLAGMTFSDGMAAGGVPGNELEIHYSVGNFHRWIFDPEANEYRRWQEVGSDEVETRLLEDRLTGEPVRAANVILVVVPHRYITPSPEFVSIELFGEGRAISFRDGQAFEIRWRRPADHGVLYFETASGDPFPLRPGSTWVELVNTSSEVEALGGGRWWVRFHIP